MKTVEIRVRPVTRWNITRHESDPEHGAGGCESLGEYDSERQANDMALAMKAQEPMARVVTSDGAVHDPEQIEYTIIGRTFEVQAPVYYAYSPEDVKKTIERATQEHPGCEFRVYEKRSNDASVWLPQV